MKKHWRGLGALAVSLGLVLGGCAEASDPPVLDGTEGGQLPPGHPEIGQAAPGQMPGAPAAGPLGVVLETMDSGGYTYALMEVDGEEIWTAGPLTPVEVGDSFSLTGAMGMQDFHSNTLDRTFDQILFLTAYTTSAGGAGSFPGSRGLVTETMNGGGYTYALVEIEGESMWLAGPETTLAVGDTVGWIGGEPMRNFSSSSLDRTWDIILFVSGFTVLD